MKASPAYRGVVCYAGLPGSGKSYSLVELACIAMREGKRVFTNAGFEIKDPVSGREAELYFSLEELLTVPNDAVVVLDEAPVYVNSRKSAEFPRGLLYRMTQVRKDGLRFYYSAIDEMMVDVNLRRVTFWTYACRRRPFGFFTRTLWPPVDRKSADDKNLGRQWFRLKKDIAAAYNTHGKVWIPPEVLEALLSDVVRGWVPLTDELVDVLWAGTRDPDRARELLEHYRRVNKYGTRVVDEIREDPTTGDGPKGQAPVGFPDSWTPGRARANGDGRRRASGLIGTPDAIDAEAGTT